MLLHSHNEAIDTILCIYMHYIDVLHSHLMEHFGYNNCTSKLLLVFAIGHDDDGFT